jgi:heme/copper-type cytochrome/quinol oxidase subunit 3
MTSASLHRDECSTGVPTGRVAMWWVIASELAIFGGLIVTYLLFRFRNPDWGAQAAHTISAAGAFNTVVLLTSSLTAVLAHDEASAGRGPAARRFLLATVALGLVFLAVKSFEYQHEIAGGFTPGKTVFWSYYYLMTGLHALHVIAGMVALTILAVHAGRGHALHRVEYGGMYWHLVDLVWIFLFPLLYLAS